jgi:hypothetical protein
VGGRILQAINCALVHVARTAAAKAQPFNAQVGPGNHIGFQPFPNSIADEMRESIAGEGDRLAGFWPGHRMLPRRWDGYVANPG